MPIYAVYERLRNARGISDYAVAKNAGLRKNIFSDWRNGIMPKFDKIIKLADFFGVPASLFYMPQEEAPAKEAANG